MIGDYLCPICKREYDSEDGAKSCLQSCLSDEYSLERKYVCPICDEAHNSEDEAWECAVECYLSDKRVVLRVPDVPGVCRTCTACDSNGERVFPCPHRADTDPPDSCAAYEPDVRHFGCHILTHHIHRQGAHQ